MVLEAAASPQHRQRGIAQFERAAFLFCRHFDLPLAAWLLQVLWYQLP
jgi:hypothetical protein